MAYYNNPSDAQLNKDMIIEDVEAYIQTLDFKGKGTAAIAVDDVTLTFTSTSFSPSVDAYTGSQSYNIVVVADGGKVLEGKVSANTATTFVFDATAAKDTATGTAGAGTDFTGGNSYNFYVLSPSADTNYPYGAYFGYTKEMSLSIENETVIFEKGVPREEIVEDVLRNRASLSAMNFTFNADVIKTILGMSDHGGNNELAFGTASNPSAKLYKFTLVGKLRGEIDIGGDAVSYKWEVFTCNFKPNGEIALGAEEHKSLPFTATAKADSLRDNKYNLLRYTPSI